MSTDDTTSDISQSGDSDTHSSNVYHHDGTTSELRAKIVNTMVKYEVHIHDGNASDFVNDIEAFLAAQKERWEATARIDELLKIEPLTHEGRGTILWEMDSLCTAIEKRIAALDGVIGGKNGIAVSKADYIKLAEKVREIEDSHEAKQNRIPLRIQKSYDRYEIKTGHAGFVQLMKNGKRIQPHNSHIVFNLRRKR